MIFADRRVTRTVLSTSYSGLRALLPQALRKKARKQGGSKASTPLSADFLSGVSVSSHIRDLLLNSVSAGAPAPPPILPQPITLLRAIFSPAQLC